MPPCPNWIRNRASTSGICRFESCRGCQITTEEIMFKPIPPGTKFGKLTVLSEGLPILDKCGKYRSTSICSCECDGKTVTIRNSDLKSGKTVSCGCVRLNSVRNAIENSPKKHATSYFLNGYVLIYDPDNPSSMTSGHPGYVYEHRAVAERILGRPLDVDEVVHHLDHDRSNNSPENLCVMSENAHAQLHALEDASIKDVCCDVCKTCGRILSDSLILRKNQRNCVMCSRDLSRKVKDRPSIQELQKLIQENGYAKTGRQFGVSDHTIRKWVGLK